MVNSIIITSDLKYEINYKGQIITKLDHLLIPTCIKSVNDLIEILNTIEKAHLCPGNCEADSSKYIMNDYDNNYKNYNNYIL